MRWVKVQPRGRSNGMKKRGRYCQRSLSLMFSWKKSQLSNRIVPSCCADAGPPTAKAAAASAESSVAIDGRAGEALRCEAICIFKLP